MSAPRTTPTSNKHRENGGDIAYSWSIRERDYEAEKANHALPSEEVFDYPLKPICVSHGKIKSSGSERASTTSSSGASTPKRAAATSAFLDPLTSVLEGMDPLSQMAELDPLSQMAIEAAAGRKSSTSLGSKKANTLDDSFEPWKSKKGAILAKYTTSEKLTFTSFDLSPAEKAILKGPTSVTEKVKNRLEQLDDFEEGSVKEQLQLSQQEYVHRIDELNQSLLAAWEQDQKVKSLKIAIQCAKLLADASVIQFYPSKFVLVTDVLDTFGRLVYERIVDKACHVAPGAATRPPAELSPEHVPESAKETCRNWFFKIASIRELTPRLYVETAILRCHGFLRADAHSDALARLAATARGVGDPLVALYARAYLCRVGMRVAPTQRAYVAACLRDILDTYRQVGGDAVQNALALQKVDMAAYLQLFSPGLDWVLQCIAHGASEGTLEEVLAQARARCNTALLLNSVMTAFRPAYVAARARHFIEHICDCEDSGFPKHLLFRTLGLCLVVADPPEAQVSVGADFERQLSFCVEARAAFSNLEPVLVHLVHTVNLLAIDTRRVVKGHHTRKTAAFVHACAAYSFITIPSITNVFLRLNLYLVSGQVALLNHCLSQADSFLKAAISLLPDAPCSIEIDGKLRSTEPLLLEYVGNLCSTLLAAPDPPAQPPLYLARGLLNALATRGAGDTARADAYTHALALLSAAAQPAFAYCADGVVANDRLYGNDPKYVGEVARLAGTVLNELMQHVHDAAPSPDRQGALALHLVEVGVTHGDLGDPRFAALLGNLWTLAAKQGHADRMLMERTAQHVKARAARGAPVAAELLRKLA
ncbi:PREDICTED: UPF0505 protein C16orf62 homolog [Priapulus caudatus]|uniref:UPF0505 protein C16orf62 homolog n=1 Tax=Priapulus caudatus TaxID=37621 RepID=A0ABM1E037_PRICU|nr:PREDICTED: UPF0505 protein C16orf62 homolog [Priapulus caudatus]